MIMQDGGGKLLLLRGGGSYPQRRWLEFKQTDLNMTLYMHWITGIIVKSILMCLFNGIWCEIKILKKM